MQKVANLADKLPILLEQIFERFNYLRFEDQTILLDLNNLLGRRLVPAALQILDHQRIIIYNSKPKTIEVAEICDKRSSGLIRLFLHINYCTCTYFKKKVLVKQKSSTGPYTCQHVLAVRIAIASKHKCLEFKEVPSYNLDMLLTSFLQTNLEIL